MSFYLLPFYLLPFYLLPLDAAGKPGLALLILPALLIIGIVLALALLRSRSKKSGS